MIETSVRHTSLLLRSFFFFSVQLVYLMKNKIDDHFTFEMKIERRWWRSIVAINIIVFVFRNEKSNDREYSLFVFHNFYQIRKNWREIFFSLFQFGCALWFPLFYLQTDFPRIESHLLRFRMSFFLFFYDEHLLFSSFIDESLDTRWHRLQPQENRALSFFLVQVGKKRHTRQSIFVQKNIRRSRSGKSTLINELFKEYPTAFAFSISRQFLSMRDSREIIRVLFFLLS